MAGRFFRCIAWILLLPGNLVSDRLGVSQENNRDLVRMLINSLFWILVGVFGLWLWTSWMPIYA